VVVEEVTESEEGGLCAMAPVAPLGAGCKAKGTPTAIR